MVTFTIPGAPISKARPRFYRRGKFVGTYNSQETEEGKAMLFLREQWRREPTIQPIILEATFFMPIPKGTSKKKTIQMIEGEIKHIKRPDCDNLLKFLKDCCNGIVWNDDSQVYKVIAEKRYSENPRTCIGVGIG